MVLVFQLFVSITKVRSKSDLCVCTIQVTYLSASDGPVGQWANGPMKSNEERKWNLTELNRKFALNGTF